MMEINADIDVSSIPLVPEKAAAPKMEQRLKISSIVNICLLAALAVLAARRRRK